MYSRSPVCCPCRLRNPPPPPGLAPGCGVGYCRRAARPVSRLLPPDTPICDAPSGIESMQACLLECTARRKNSFCLSPEAIEGLVYRHDDLIPHARLPEYGHLPGKHVAEAIGQGMNVGQTRKPPPHCASPTTVRQCGRERFASMAKLALLSRRVIHTAARIRSSSPNSASSSASRRETSRPAAC